LKKIVVGLSDVTFGGNLVSYVFLSHYDTRRRSIGVYQVDEIFSFALQYTKHIRFSYDLQQSTRGEVSENSIKHSQRDVQSEILTEQFNTSTDIRSKTRARYSKSRKKGRTSIQSSEQ